MTNIAPIVFVVDDDTAIRESLEDLLRSVGLRMVGFSRPEDYLACDRPDVPSCLILDVRLPGISGLELQRELAANDSKIPIIFITGHGDIPMSVRAMKAGATEFFTKPVRHQDLIETVQKAIDRDRARRCEELHLMELRERFAALTLREREVMAVLVTGRLNKQIGAMVGATESTIKAHRTQIMRKMRAGSLAELVRMADKLHLPSIDSTESRLAVA